MRTLLDEAAAYEQSGAYAFQVGEASRTSNSITYRCYAVEHEGPPDEWSLLAGEAIQNLRSSLDHVVWAASSDQTNDTGFPICTKAEWFARSTKAKLRGVPEKVRHAIEKAQPYQTAPDAPQEAMLERLRVLSNVDKHRTLATVAAAIQHEGVGTPEGVEITWEKYATGRPLGYGKTHVSTFTATSPAPVDNLKLEPLFDYHVQIEGRRINALKGIVSEVWRALYECEAGRPLSPFAPYPL